MKFVKDEPALIVEKTLILADIHLGVEYDYKRAGLKMPSQTKATTEKIINLAKKNKTKKILLVGDIKHKVPGTTFQEQREVPEFFEMLSKKYTVEVIPGNHDGGIHGLIPDITIHPATGVSLGKTYVCHGHSWPSPDVLRAKFLIISHNHPLVELRDSLGFRWRERAWIRADLDQKSIQKQYINEKIKKLPELVIMPAFSDLVGGYPMNQTKKKPLGPLVRAADIENARIFLLDGTYLGEINELQIKD